MRILRHDLSKFRLDEWMPYVRHFYPIPGEKSNSEDFSRAVQRHYFRNMHHLEHAGMPLNIDIREMLADWTATERMRTGKWDIQTYFEQQIKSGRLTKLSKVQIRKMQDLISNFLEEHAR